MKTVDVDGLLDDAERVAVVHWRDEPRHSTGQAWLDGVRSALEELRRLRRGER